MGDKSKIEWCDATWNPVVGCSKVSEGCRNCYAFDLHNMRHKAKMEGKRLPEQYAKPFSQIQTFPDRLDQPLRWRRPRRIFVNSLSDLFHPDVPDQFIVDAFTIMAEASHHTFQILTKRPERMKEFLSDPYMANNVWVGTSSGLTEREAEWPLPNVWIGVTVENQQTADERIPLLLQTTAAVRWLSCEPLLGPVNLQSTVGGTLWIGGQRGCSGQHSGIGTPECPREPHHHHDERCGPGIDWVVCGGESGSKARPMHPDWAKSLRDQCQAAGVPFLFKQWGEWGIPFPDIPFSGRQHTTVVKGETNVGMFRFGKRVAGRLLDGRTWDEYPQSNSEEK